MSADADATHPAPLNEGPPADPAGGPSGVGARFGAGRGVALFSALGWATFVVCGPSRAGRAVPRAPCGVDAHGAGVRAVQRRWAGRLSLCAGRPWLVAQFPAPLAGRRCAGKVARGRGALFSAVGLGAFRCVRAVQGWSCSSPRPLRGGSWGSAWATGVPGRGSGGDGAASEGSGRVAGAQARTAVVRRKTERPPGEPLRFLEAGACRVPGGEPATTPGCRVPPRPSCPPRRGCAARPSRGRGAGR
ncbi:hypothetical protein SUDANB13_03774 [Streptomyces sp. enrichment culture]